MKKEHMIAIILVLLTYGFTVKSARSTQSNTKTDCSNGLCVSFEMSSQKFNIMDVRKIDITTTLTNESDVPLVISPYRNVHIEIAGDGASYTPNPVSVPPPWFVHAIIIDPGEAYSYLMKGLCDIDGCWSIEKGTYDIKCIYSITEKEASYPTIKNNSEIQKMRRMLWIGDVETRTNKIEVI